MKRLFVVLTGAALLCNGGALAQPQKDAPPRGQLRPPDVPNGPFAELQRVGWKIDLGTPAEAKEAIRSLEGIDGRLGALANSLGRALKHPDPQVRKEAALRLAELGSAATGAYHLLCEALKDPDPEVRTAVLRALAVSRPPAPRIVVQTVLPLLREKNAAVRAQAIITVGCLGSGVKDAVSPLADLLHDETIPHPTTAPDLSIAYYAVKALGQIGPNAVAALPPLLELTRHQSRPTRWEAFEAVAKIGPTDPRVRKLLQGALESPDDRRLLALGAMPNLGCEDARELCPVVVKLLRVRDQERVAEAAAEVLWKVGEGKEVIDALTELARDQQAHPDARLSAIGALGRFGAEAKSAVPALVGVMEEDQAVERRLVRAAGEVVLGLGADAVPHLVRLLRSDSQPLRRQSIGLLGRLGAAGNQSLPALDNIAKDPKDPMSRQAGQAAQKIRDALAKPAN
jgi:HEAT repeat protein